MVPIKLVSKNIRGIEIWIEKRIEEDGPYYGVGLHYPNGVEKYWPHKKGSRGLFLATCEFNRLK